MTPRARWLILGFALLGLGFASTSSWVHYRLLTDPGYVSPCDINTTFNCTQAYLSRFGAMFGVPVALAGVAWFALVALIAAFAKPDAPGGTTSSPAGSYVFGLATIGLAMVLYLGFASAFRLKTFCLLCIGTYVSVIAVFIVSGLTTSVAMTRLPLRLMGDARSIVRRPLTLLIALLYICGAGSGVALFPREMKAATVPPPPPPKDAQEQFSQAWAMQPRVDLGISPGSAKVIVVKFNDWLCPSCKAYALAYQPVFDRYEKAQPGAVKVIIKDWPWNTDCNFSAQSIPGHEGSCNAAVAVRLARERGKGEAMVDWLFANQDRLDEQGRSGAGAQAKQDIRSKVEELLGVKDFEREYAARLMEIRRDVADGAALHVVSTPTFFVNGVRIPDGQLLPPQYLDMAIKIELQKSGGKQ
jgi:uncharacterized membrane protein/protein-disulfide isomerase